MRRTTRWETDKDKQMIEKHFPEGIANLPVWQGHFNARSLDTETCQVLFASYDAGQTIPPHDHETKNYGVVTKGELILTKDGQEQRYGLGQWYDLNPKQTHAARFEVDTAIIEFWFQP